MLSTSEESSENVRSQNLDTRFTSRTNCFLANLRIWLYSTSINNNKKTWDPDISDSDREASDLNLNSKAFDLITCYLTTTKGYGVSTRILNLRGRWQWVKIEEVPSAFRLTLPYRGVNFRALLLTVFSMTHSISSLNLNFSITIRRYLPTLFRPQERIYVRRCAH